MWKHATSSRPWHPTPKAKPIRRRQPPPATPRHPNHSLPLLPSGPGGVCKLSSRGNRRRSPLKSGVQIAVESKSCKRQSRAHKQPNGGERGIRTLDTGFSRIHTFQACSFSRSDTSPQDWISLRFGAIRGNSRPIGRPRRIHYTARTDKRASIHRPRRDRNFTRFSSRDQPASTGVLSGCNQPDSPSA